jgi:hypothetical protein
VDARGRRRGWLTGAGALAALVLAACGGSTGDSSGAGAVHGRFPVAVQARFAKIQQLAGRTTLDISVHNSGRRALPDVAVTICETSCAVSSHSNEGTSAQAFGYDIAAAPNTADPSRPLWIVNRGPGACHLQCNASGASNGGGVSAASNTWALGRLAPGHTARFTWSLTPVKAGHHVIAWQVAGNLTGTARAVSGGTIPHGTLSVSVSGHTPQLRVTASGRVVTTSSRS